MVDLPALRQVLSCAARLTSHAATRPALHAAASSPLCATSPPPLTPTAFVCTWLVPSPLCALYSLRGDARHGQVWQGARRQLAARHADVVAALLRDHHRLVGLDHRCRRALLQRSSFTSIDSAFSTRVVGSSSTFDLTDARSRTSGGPCGLPRESKRKASQLGGSGGADSFSSAYPVSRKDSESTDGDGGIQLGGDMLGSGLLPIAERNHLLPLLKGGSSGKQAAPTPRATTKGSGKASAKQQQQQLTGAGAGGSSSSHAPRAECAADEPGMIEL